jgi:hypothetical protein
VKSALGNANMVAKNERKKKKIKREIGKRTGC